MASGTRSHYQRPTVQSVSPILPARVSVHATSQDQQTESRYAVGNNVNDQAGAHRAEVSRLSEELQPLQISRVGNQISSVASSREAPASIDHHEADPLAENMNEVISAISKLESLGLRQLRIPLPNCVVLGEQSTGKSSLIEAISGIRTPRATDTCTRCPIFLKMEPSGDLNAGWQARISLRKGYEYDGLKKGKFPGWTPCAPTIIDFASTENAEELEKLIARAQLAVLSPFDEPKSFLLPGKPKSHHTMAFSPNVVSIHLSKPGLPALSFYDLPGIIGQSEADEDSYLVKFVEDLVVEYISDANSLVLLTYSLENDLANSAAGGIARKMKATGRCIGVLTKPDRLPLGCRMETLEMVLNGSTYKLGHGYYVVKNPGQDGIDKNLTHREAREQEAHFFEQTHPWASTLRDRFGDRFGTQRLQKKLSETLATQMTKSLPTIQDKVSQRLQETEAELKRYPEPPTHNATRVVSDIVIDFAAHIQREMEAEYPCRIWRNTWESLHEKFYAGLLSMKPTMLTSGELDKGIYAEMTSTTAGGGSREEALVIDSEGEFEGAMTESPETPCKKRRFDGPASMPLPASAGRNPILTQSTSKRPANLKPKSTGAKSKDHTLGAYDKFRKRFNLDEVTQYLRATSKSRLPDQLDPRVIDDLIVTTIQHWELPLQNFFDEFQQKLMEQVRAIFDDHFGQWSCSALYEQAWKIVSGFLVTNLAQHRDVVAAESLADEREGPYVFNRATFEREKTMIRDTYRQHRYRAREHLFAKELFEETDKQLTPQEREKLRKDDKKRSILEREPYKTEIDVIAQVATYYMIAAQRFYEAVCMRIESRLFKALRTTLRDELESGLGIHEREKGPQNAIHLLAESPQRCKARTELQAMQNALMQGLEMLRNLQHKYGNGTDTLRFEHTLSHPSDEMEDITHNSMDC